MTIEKATKFQNDLRELFRKYGVASGCAVFMHNETLHPIEAHVTEKNEFIVKLLDGFVQALRAAYQGEEDFPIWEHWSPNDDN